MKNRNFKIPIYKLLFELINHFFPSVNLAISMATVGLPIALIAVAGASIMIPIVAIAIKALGGKLYMLTISISPINPPPGIPDITTPLNTEIIMAIKYVSIPLKLLPKIINLCLFYDNVLMFIF